MTTTDTPARTGLFARALGLIKRHSRELSGFLSIGGAAFIVDAGLFNLLYIGYDWSYWYAKILSAVVSMTLAFFGNRHWTWRERRGSAAAHRQYALYFFFNGIGLLISMGCLWINSRLAEVWPHIFDTKIAVNVAALLFGVGIASVFRFFAYRTWVFRRLPQLQEAPETA
ncbi:GtrA family protein [Glycomyces artemisiae]|uniref:Putative flippase GtrA n=1 Tax=Glycomyces artemisiae TaxID=1076443 RepID=A0A2T0UE35_9ACTN|nr:GtrA family protein [Glycomyces artemisiae]PRY56205.1 putative flippase GtrA [Glycomyces artemisiae]